MKKEENPNSKKEKIKKNILNINNNPANLYLCDNHFLIDENIKKILGKKNNYQNQYLNKQIYDSSSEKKHHNITKYNNSYININKSSKDKEKEKLNSDKIHKNYYSENNSNLTEKNFNNYDENVLLDNFCKLKEMNSDLNNILSQMKMNFETSNENKRSHRNNNTNYLEISKGLENKNKKSKTERKNIFGNNKYSKENNSIKNYQDKDYNNNKNIINNSKEENKKNYNLKNNSVHKYDDKKEKLVIDQVNRINIIINGIKDKININAIKLHKLNLKDENKLKSIYNNDERYKNIKLEDLINDLYEYKIKYQELKNIIENKEDEKNKFDENFIELKKENEILNNKKKFLINELTKSIYYNEKLNQKYKDELVRIDSYINKIDFDLNSNNQFNKI